MSKNIFKKWEPISGLPTKIYLEGLHHDYEGFRLLLKASGGQAKMLRITFDPALVYRNIDEGDYLNYGADYSQLEPMEWSFFIVEKSNFLDWFQQVSQEIHDLQNIVHYAIHTPNDCVDILSAYPPKVEWLN